MPSLFPLALTSSSPLLFYTFPNTAALILNYLRWSARLDAFSQTPSLFPLALANLSSLPLYTFPNSVVYSLSYLY